jgi:hypothetical protein
VIADIVGNALKRGAQPGPSGRDGGGTVCAVVIAADQMPNGIPRPQHAITEQPPGSGEAVAAAEFADQSWDHGGVIGQLAGHLAHEALAIEPDGHGTVAALYLNFHWLFG